MGIHVHRRLVRVATRNKLYKDVLKDKQYLNIKDGFVVTPHHFLHPVLFHPSCCLCFDFTLWFVPPTTHLCLCCPDSLFLLLALLTNSLFPLLVFVFTHQSRSSCCYSVSIFSLFSLATTSSSPSLPFSLTTRFLSCYFSLFTLTSLNWVRAELVID